MAKVKGVIDKSVDDAMVAIRREASMQGYALADGSSGHDWLVFKKGVTAVSFGSELRVRFEAQSPAETLVTITPDEKFALTDLGRGKRAARRLLEAVEARTSADHEDPAV
jgi:hypothetical protein